MILVTGASGFLGQHLVRSLSATGTPVRALFHHTEPDAALRALPEVNWHKADLLDVYDVAEAMKGVTHVYHCAAIVSYQPGARDRVLHFNPESTANIVNEALESGIEKMVYVSSIAALGRAAIEGGAITEEEQWGENHYGTAYAISKYMAETEVWRGIGEGLNAVIINPGIILGEGNFDSGSAELVKVAWNEFPFYTNGITAWVDVADVVRIAITLMGSELHSERYIVSAGNYSYREIFDKMARALGRKPPRFYANRFITGLVWRWGKLKELTGKNPLITKETARNAHSVSIFNNSKLLNSLPDFNYTSLQSTVDRVCSVFVASKHKN